MVRGDRIRMTMGGISSSLNVTLARLSAIESNFQALNNVAQELNSHSILNTNADFKTVFDNKINNINADKNEPEQKNNAILPVYDDEIIPVLQKTPQADETTLSGDLNTEEIQESPAIEKTNEGQVTQNIDLKPKISLDYKNMDIDKIIETISDKYNVDSDFIKAIIKQESGFNPKATSKKGAMGLMQLMPSTAKSLGVNDAYNPWENIEGGVKHIKNLLEKYENNRELALAAYNAGQGAVQRYGGIPPYKETQNYVKAILSAYNKTKEAQI